MTNKLVVHYRKDWKKADVLAENAKEQLHKFGISISDRDVSLWWNPFQKPIFVVSVQLDALNMGVSAWDIVDRFVLIHHNEILWYKLEIKNLGTYQSGTTNFLNR